MAAPSYSDFMTTGWQSYLILTGIAVAAALLLGYFDVLNLGKGASYVFLFLLGLTVSKLFYRQTRMGRDWFIVLLISLPVVYAIQLFLPLPFDRAAAVFLAGFLAVFAADGDIELYQESRY